ncbi:hypothetical protein [Pedobacter sp. JY14-1]|uniref:hypothetical protein n=1 Tax=Pedobacter sp. JY14-1 TaxID=3034151 RepID=UPI0023E34C09|nr:hypothetical protein [Pedobacter sp. JY14-1]
MYHTLHIPVLGLGYSIDTPLKVARYGISSVVSIVDDQLAERMRKYHSELNGIRYVPISSKEEDSRAKRITAYLDLMDQLVAAQMDKMKQMDFSEINDLNTYFEFLPDDNPAKKKYRKMVKTNNISAREKLQRELKQVLSPGNIDVNIMSKVDKVNYFDGEALSAEYTDALSALRGFVRSKLNSSLVISAGMNPRLFNYMETFSCFHPDTNGHFQKKIILKVSDFRSAQVQAKVLAKKGLWVTEFRIESGLNCGGHAFATEGHLIGPILQQFKDNKDHLYAELYQLYIQALVKKNLDQNITRLPQQRITVQGGVGNSDEHRFLLNEYLLDAVGWGSPFLLVPEATNVDDHTLNALSTANEDDFYISNASPLGVPFNNFRKCTAEQLRLERIGKGKPGSPCTKKYLCNNTEFTEQPICTASRQYQKLKIARINASDISESEKLNQINKVTEKVCLCEGLCASAYLKADIVKPKESKAVSICPGPNIAYFKGIYSLKQMVDHIYGRCNLLKGVSRPNLFIKELELYISYLKQQCNNLQEDLKQQKYLFSFYNQLMEGIRYYQEMAKRDQGKSALWDSMQLDRLNQSISSLRIISSLFSFA